LGDKVADGISMCILANNTNTAITDCQLHSQLLYYEFLLFPNRIHLAEYSAICASTVTSRVGLRFPYMPNNLCQQLLARSEINFLANQATFDGDLYNLSLMVAFKNSGV